MSGLLEMFYEEEEGVIKLVGAMMEYLAHPRRVPPVIENVLNGRLRLLHPSVYTKVPRHNPGFKLTEAQIREVMEETGADRDLVERVAMWVPGQYLRFAAIKGWSCARCVTCVGLVRKVVWCAICVATKPPALTVEEAANLEIKSGGAIVPPKPLRAGDMLVGGEPSMKRRTHFPEMVNEHIWVTPLTK